MIVVGAAGQLGSAFRRRLDANAQYLERGDADLTNPGEIGSAIRAQQPDLIINCAGYNAVDAAESDEATARRVNALAVQEIAIAARDVGARLVTFSSDYVFDGTKRNPYTENDPPSPVNAYGRSKREGEILAMEANPSTLVVRASWMISGTHPSFLTAILDQLALGEVRVVDDQIGSLTLADDLVAGTLEAIDAGATGTVHIANTGAVTRFELAQAIASASGSDPSRVVPCSTDEVAAAATRPAYSVLDSVRRDELGMSRLPGFHDALERAVEQLAGS